MKINPVKKGEILEIYTDGASRGNPGPAAWSFIFVKDGKIIHKRNGFIGFATNNTAEYNAIIEALNEAEKFTRWEIKVFSDSELAIKQIKKIYRIKKPHLSELCEKVYSLCNKFEKTDFFNVGREHRYIQENDTIVNQCLDENYGKK